MSCPCDTVRDGCINEIGPKQYHFALWRSLPLKSNRPGISGHFQLLSMAVSRLAPFKVPMLDLLQESRRVDEVVRLILLDLTALLELDLPLGRLLIPDRLLDGRAELHIFGEVVLLRRALDVPLDLLLVYVELGPVRVTLEGEDVSVFDLVSKRPLSHTPNPA